MSGSFVASTPLAVRRDPELGLYTVEATLGDVSHGVPSRTIERESTRLSRAGEEVVPDPEEAIVQMMKLVIAMIVDVQVLHAYLHGEMKLITARLPLVDAILPRDRASSSVGIGGFLLRCHLCFSSPCNPMNKELCRLFRMYNL